MVHPGIYGLSMDLKNFRILLAVDSGSTPRKKNDILFLGIKIIRKQKHYETRKDASRQMMWLFRRAVSVPNREHKSVLSLWERYHGKSCHALSSQCRLQQGTQERTFRKMHKSSLSNRGTIVRFRHRAQE